MGCNHLHGASLRGVPQNRPAASWHCDIADTVARRAGCGVHNGGAITSVLGPTVAKQ